MPEILITIVAIFAVLFFATITVLVNFAAGYFIYKIRPAVIADFKKYRMNINEDTQHIDEAIRLVHPHQ